MNPAQNASPAPTGSTTTGSGTAGRTIASSGAVAVDRHGAHRAQLDHGHRRPELEGGPCQFDRVVVGGQAGQDRQLVRAAEDDVGARDERAQDRGGRIVRPEAAAQVDVEADRQAGRRGGLDGALGRGVGVGGEGGGDARQVEPAGAVVHVRRHRALDVRLGQARACRVAPRVDDVGGPDHAALAEHQAGRGVRIDRQVA